jgi:phytanoyl-CoA hydroxylase
MLDRSQIDAYGRDGYLVIPDVFTAVEVAAMRRAVDTMVENSRTVSAHDHVFDLEPGHSATTPRVRRLKNPERHDSAFAACVKNPGILGRLSALWGPDIRFDFGKLNMKAAEFGSPVEWHQDWAFYPHTNDDLAAVGVMLDDTDETNGALLVLPGSHKGPVYDHHVDGRFCGAMDPTRDGLDFSRAIACVGKAGSISIHHCRLVHGSAPNASERQRRLYLLQYGAADSWPLMPKPASWDAVVVAGQQTWTPRMIAAPVRLPLPPAAKSGSIYESQSVLKNKFFPADHSGAVQSRPSR